ncbi:hypothetical protein [Sodalinema gerasimenkoae]|uniref:hypothetical protein n=1 Tax=Sodalinema gerasimenkoae TaxID=2862348 RepID=UPI0013587859|nr:hypothetical protein [Sodalinema gerasimenkoae]
MACEPSEESATSPRSTPEQTPTNESVASDYPAEAIDRFLESCTGGDPAMQRSCSCAIEEIQQRYSFEEFVELEQEIEAGRDDGTVLAELLQVCQ